MNQLFGLQHRGVRNVVSRSCVNGHNKFCGKLFGDYKNNPYLCSDVINEYT